MACSPVAERGEGEERCSGQRVGPFGPLEQESSWLMRRWAPGPGRCRARLGSAGGAELFGFETISRGAKGRQALISEAVAVRITHRAGASAAPIRQPARPPGLWAVRPRATSAGPFSANESLGPGK